MAEPSQPPPASGATPFLPVAPDERIALLDALRGFALAGVLLVNMGGFKFPIAAHLDASVHLFIPGDLNDIARRALMWLAQAKFIPIFSLLLGIGLALQQKRATARGLDFAPFIRWRMALLAAAGVIHGMLLWPGDILLLYGLFGLISPFLLARSPRILFLAAAAIALIAFMAHVWISALMVGWEIPPHSPEVAAEWIDAYRHASPIGIIQLRIQEWKMLWTFSLISDFSYSFLFYILGLALGKSDRFSAWISLGFRPGRAFAITVLFGAIAAFAAVHWFLSGAPIRLLPNVLANTGYLLGSWLLACGYIVGFTRLHAATAASWLMNGLAAVGRMSLTNYLLQSVVANGIFLPAGLGLYGRVSVAEGIALSLAIFAGQIIFSRWWLAHHPAGPAESLWRFLSYPR